ncbi:MAG: hypothetical protein AAFR59_18140 [Bacteroidota bacterium]
MAISFFGGLTEQEQNQLLLAPSMVTVLVAGADQNIDKKEKDWATKLVQFRTFTSHTKLHDYYEAVDARFSQDLESLTANWNAETTETHLTTELGKVGEILPKIDASIASELRDSLRSLAGHVAKASGGFLGMGGVDGDEARIMKLEMLG